MITNVLGLIGIRVAEKSVELHADIDSSLPLRLLGDPLRLMQILNNLLSNAVKFTQQGDIVLTVRGTERTRDTLQLELVVQDTGVGMTEDQQARLFQAFTQADGSTTRKFGGTGLGLAICHQLTESWRQHSCASRPGEGSMFTVRLPFDIVEDQSASGQLMPAPEFNQQRVLVVDDNPTARAILQRFLTALTFQVDTAASGSEALQLLCRQEQTAFSYVHPDGLADAGTGRH